MLGLFFTLLVSGFAVAQGSDGRTESFVPATAPRAKPKIAKASFQRRVKPKPIPIKPGTLLISINETASSVDLTRVDDLSKPALSITTNGPISRSLDAGKYELRIKKYGFFDETRNVDLAPGEYRKVDVIMRPKMSPLTVKANLNDAEIDVENVGKFTEPLKRYLVMPGKYRITVRRHGYASQTITTDLSVAGKEQNIYVVLEPLRIE